MLIVTKNHPFRYEGVMQLACEMTLFFMSHLGVDISEIYVKIITDWPTQWQLI